MKILFVTAYFPPATGGTSVVIHNLAGLLNPGSIAGVVTSSAFRKHLEAAFPVFYLFPEQAVLLGRRQFLTRRWFHRTNLTRLRRIIRKTGATHIVGVYPDFEFLQVAVEAALLEGVPCIPYLHDTMEEGLGHIKWYAKSAKKLEEYIFRKSPLILVISDGLKKIYDKKYNRDTVVVRHTYPESPGRSFFSTARDTLFFGGMIYDINAHSLRRVSNVCAVAGLKLVLSTPISLKNRQRLGLVGDHIEYTQTSREGYLQQLSRQGILLITLDQEEESPVHSSELSSIFPTKTIEYLFAGRPILVHAPAHYFIAQFIQAHDCGVVVHSRNPEVLLAAIEALRTDTERQAYYVHRAFKAGAQFLGAEIQQIFLTALSQVASSK